MAGADVDKHSELLWHAGGVALSPEHCPCSGKSGPQREREHTPTQVHRQKNSALKNIERFEEEERESNV